MTAPGIPPTMMALRAHARGGPEQLFYEEAPTPEPGPGEALVEAHAGAITFTELTWDQTWTTSDGRDRAPSIPSHEVSGTVVRLGSGATGAAVGDETSDAIKLSSSGGKFPCQAAVLVTAWFGNAVVSS